MLEVEKYEDIYANPKEYPNYGGSNHGKKILQLIDTTNIKSVCDVGCGLGNMCISLANEGIEHVIGIDFAAPFPKDDRIEWLRCDAKNLGLPDQSVDCLTAFDVLEHILPEDVDAVLKEFRRVAIKGWIFSIAYKPSVCMKYILHPTVRPEAWWLEKLLPYGQITQYENYLIVGFEL